MSFTVQERRPYSPKPYVSLITSSDKDKRNPLRFENFLQIASSPPKFHVLHPNNRKDLLVLDNHFRSWIQQFNSKQIRAMKEHLWSMNICIDDADWQTNQDGTKSPPGEPEPELGYSTQTSPVLTPI